MPKDKSLESWIQDAACSIRIDLTHTGWQEEEKLSGIAWHGGLKAIEDLEKDLKREGGKA